MTKFFVLIAVSLLSAGAMAQESVDTNDQADQAYAQQLNQDEMQTFASPGQVIGGVIGGIIGGAIGGRDDHRGGWGPGHGPGHGGPGHGPRPRPRAWVCYAKNMRRQVFQARDWDQRRASQMAMRECVRASRHCQPAGCQAY